MQDRFSAENLTGTWRCPKSASNPDTIRKRFTGFDKLDESSKSTFRGRVSSESGTDIITIF